MERSTSFPTGMGEQSLTPGEQRILALMEQGHQRMEQRMEQMDQRMERMDQRMELMDQRMELMDQQLHHLSFKVDQEAAASKMRDRQLEVSLQRLQEQSQERNVWLKGEIERSQQAILAALYAETNTLRTELSERLAQHHTRLEVVERTLEAQDARTPVTP